MEIALNLDFLANVVGTTPGELSKALKLDDEGNVTASKDDIEGLLKSHLEEKVKTIQRTARDEGHGRAKRETLEQVEKELAEEFGLERKNVREMFSEYSEKVKSQGGTIDPNEIKNSEPYQQLKKSLESKLQTVQTEYDQFKNQVEFQQITSAIKQKGSSILTSENYELPENQEVRNNLISLLVKEAVGKSDVKFKVSDDGISVTDAEGRNVLDSEGNPVTFDRYFTQIAGNYLPKREGQKRDTPGGSTTPPSGQTGISFPATVTNRRQAQEFAINNPDLKPEEKRAYLEAARSKFAE